MIQTEVPTCLFVCLPTCGSSVQLGIVAECFRRLVFGVLFACWSWVVLWGRKAGRRDGEYLFELCVSGPESRKTTD